MLYIIRIPVKNILRNNPHSSIRRSMKPTFKIRAVQLDLARQMESLDFIKEFIDLAAKNHYNTLFLYLEWRIRTRCVDLGETEGYSKEELREIISYAAKYNMTVIPGLATLGHGDLLLARKEYENLSELRGKLPGRFPGSDGQAIDLCASLPEVKKLLKDYLTECAEIFADCPYLHVGLDEVHNLGYCKECRKKIASYADEGKIFLEHLLYVYDIVKSCSKKMMIWDDMFEFYEELLPFIPKDVVLVNWLYHDNVYEYKGHFFNQTFRDLPGQYEKLDLQYLIAPADYTSGNIESFTLLAEKYNPAGGMLTSWEKAGTLLYKSFPNIAFCGQLWNSRTPDAAAAEKTALEELFPSVRDEIFFSALSLYNTRMGTLSTVSFRSLTLFDFHGPDKGSCHALQSVVHTLEGYFPRLQTEQEKKILQDILFDCRIKLLAMESKNTAFLSLNGLKHEDFSLLREKVTALEKEYLPFYLPERPYDKGEMLRNAFQEWRNALEKVALLPERGYLKLRLMLSDYYAAPFLKVSVNGREIAFSSWKISSSHLYTVYLPLPEGTASIQTVELEVTGFGAQAIAYLSGYAGGEIYLPASVKDSSGVVVNGENVLREDITYALLGTDDVEACYKDRKLSGAVSALAVAMRKG